MALVGLAAAPAEPLWIDLAPEQIRQAVEHGTTTFEARRQARKAADDLDPEYVVDLGPDVGQAYLYTEFGAVALETRRWLAIGQKITEDAAQAVAVAARGRLVISVTVLGPTRDFLRSYRVSLAQGATSHAPIHADVYRAGRQPEGAERHRAGAVYTFRAAGVDPSAPATLVLGEATGRELRFDFDLPRLR